MKNRYDFDFGCTNVTLAVKTNGIRFVCTKGKKVEQHILIHSVDRFASGSWQILHKSASQGELD